METVKRKAFRLNRSTVVVIPKDFAKPGDCILITRTSEKTILLEKG